MILSVPTILVAFATFFQVVQAANNCASSNAKATKSIRFRIAYAPSSMDSNTVSSWSDGGGSRTKINENGTDLSNPFAGREYAGGGRWDILGTTAYGSGYPYGATDVKTIKGRPFPHAMWPISWGPGYLGGEEYWGDDIDLLRPGGAVGTINILTKDTSKWPNVGSDEVYTMIGDKESLTFMISDLVRVCHAAPATPRKFDPTTNATNSTQPRPENVVQYYRSSSFALAYPKYNNTFALPSSNLTTNHGSVPLPGSIINSPFLRCVNDTIRASLPLMDAFQKPKKKLSPGAIAGIVIGSVAGAILLLVFCIVLKR
ncbi:hypothetical protein FRC14_005777 [Serendipita sp. 396]|nr:hypothetical protein FRC14_005777 [Serendipita sp. 396]KAG8772429.1 hypothetical protein FRC15_002729 [Serendipita sp. 397]KAG8790902.1 hypothetical protein FRC16_000678 [Serendipita sp. 398]KAG8830251.1 hypothetical protein FRC18_008394 [Serendipita sp. 400]KAG8861510.1 hypothetical protein FRB91_006218 [Serendipita sp. 411]KAG8865510.1 hypothetical protein FRC20_009753 [Serendipita sp. 405]